MRTLLSSGNRTKVELRQLTGTNEVWLEKSLLDFADVAPERLALGREARLQLLARGPYVPDVLDAVVGRPLRTFRREYIEGASLRDLDLTSHDPDGSLRISLLAQLCSALVRFHESLGIFHGDLTPSNVIVSTRARLWIVDFGLARFIDEPIADDEILRGAPRYLAPELTRGIPPSPASDIYQTANLATRLFPEEHSKLLPRLLREALRRASAPEPRSRPRARELLASFPLDLLSRLEFRRAPST